ncbi:MAG TPA: ubiquinol oxidase subunit II [Paraburkholderia sp.]
MANRKAIKRLLIPLVTGLGSGLIVSLSGCSDLALLDPKGSVGAAEKTLILTAGGAMLLVVIPVIILTLLFAWHYRSTNHKATYAPKWSFSMAIEVAVWTIPALIVLFLGILTWKTSHELDPYKPLEAKAKPINVEVVALNWKWLFIYPDLGIATVNQLAMPVGTPVNFQVTSDAVMNSFFIPQLGSQIYAMAGMQTRLHLIADEAGDYAGISSSYSGKGYSDMKFRALAMSDQDFDAWVAKVKAGQQPLSMDRYATMAEPSEKDPVQYFSSVDPKLFRNIVGKYNNGIVKEFDDAACRTKG